MGELGQVKDDCRPGPGVGQPRSRHTILPPIASTNLARSCERPDGVRTPTVGKTSFCIFQEPWWLDAVAPGAWRLLQVVRGGQVAARMAVVCRRHFGFRVIRQPPLTPTLGPWIASSEASLPKRMADEKDLFNRLIDQLPTWDYFEAAFHHRITNWLPFHWRGFEQTTRYTYLLSDISDIERVWSGLHECVRRNIRKAQRRLSVRTDLSLDHLLDVVELTFVRQQGRLPFRRSLLQRIDAACTARDARRMFFAEDQEKRIHAAIYVVTDRHYAYYLLGGADPRYRESGAQNLLLWEAIRFASSASLRFDFEGSMIESIERVFRNFGATQTPYLHIRGAKPLANFLLSAAPDRLLRALSERL